jgi:hypothetical protein
VQSVVLGGLAGWQTVVVWTAFRPSSKGEGGDTGGSLGRTRMNLTCEWLV